MSNWEGRECVCLRRVVVSSSRGQPEASPGNPRVRSSSPVVPVVVCLTTSIGCKCSSMEFHVAKQLNEACNVARVMLQHCPHICLTPAWYHSVDLGISCCLTHRVLPNKNHKQTNRTFNKHHLAGVFQQTSPSTLKAHSHCVPCDTRRIHRDPQGVGSGSGSVVV